MTPSCHRGKGAGPGAADAVAASSPREAPTYYRAMRLRPMLQVRDVAQSSAWYHDVLGLRSGHGGDEYDMLFSGDEFVLQLHREEAGEHRIPGGEPGAGGGAGITLWFEAEHREGFDVLVAQARQAGAAFLGEPQWNPKAHHHEATVLDPDGYVVVLHSPFEPD